MDKEISANIKQSFHFVFEIHGSSLIHNINPVRLLNFFRAADTRRIFFYRKRDACKSHPHVEQQTRRPEPVFVDASQLPLAVRRGPADWYVFTEGLLAQSKDKSNGLD